MSDSSEGAQSTRATGTDFVVVVFALLFALPVSAVPAILGPMMAPGVLPVFADAFCPTDSVGARTAISARRGRRGTSHDWRLECELPSGAVVHAPRAPSFLAAWLIFSGGLVATLSVAGWTFSRLDRRVTGGRK